MELRVAAYGIIVDADRILLTHWAAHGHAGWTLPGGGLEPGEDPADAAVREIFEETGHAASIDRLLGIDSVVIRAAERIDRKPEDAHSVRIIYQATITGGDLRNEVGGSSDEARWFALDELDALDTVSLVPAGMRMWHEKGATRESG